MEIFGVPVGAPVSGAPATGAPASGAPASAGLPSPPVSGAPASAGLPSPAKAGAPLVDAGDPTYAAASARGKIGSVTFTSTSFGSAPHSIHESSGFAPRRVSASRDVFGMNGVIITHTMR